MLFCYNVNAMNYLKFYQNIRDRWEGKEKWIRIANLVLTYFFYISYPALLVFIFVKNKNLLWKFILIPGISFVLLSWIRDKINKNRPYEQYPIDPIIKKETKGNSMPSRHIFSSVIISMCFLYFHVPTGLTMLLLSVISSVIRVIGGVHYPIDVAIGFLCGLICGFLLFLP